VHNCGASMENENLPREEMLYTKPQLTLTRVGQHGAWAARSGNPQDSH